MGLLCRYGRWQRAASQLVPQHVGDFGWLFVLQLSTLCGQPGSLEDTLRAEQVWRVTAPMALPELSAYDPSNHTFLAGAGAQRPFHVEAVAEGA